MGMRERESTSRRNEGEASKKKQELLIKRGAHARIGRRRHGHERRTRGTHVNSFGQNVDRTLHRRQQGHEKQDIEFTMTTIKTKTHKPQYALGIYRKRPPHFPSTLAHEELITTREARTTHFLVGFLVLVLVGRRTIEGLVTDTDRQIDKQIQMERNREKRTRKTCSHVPTSPSVAHTQPCWSKERLCQDRALRAQAKTLMRRNKDKPSDAKLSIKAREQ